MSILTQPTIADAHKLLQPLIRKNRLAEFMGPSLERKTEASSKMCLRLRKGHNYLIINLKQDKNISPKQPQNVTVSFLSSGRDHSKQNTKLRTTLPIALEYISQLVKDSQTAQDIPSAKEATQAIAPKTPKAIAQAKPHPSTHNLEKAAFTFNDRLAKALGQARQPHRLLPSLHPQHFFLHIGEQGKGKLWEFIHNETTVGGSINADSDSPAQKKYFELSSRKFFQGLSQHLDSQAPLPRTIDELEEGVKGLNQNLSKLDLEIFRVAKGKTRKDFHPLYIKGLGDFTLCVSLKNRELHADWCTDFDKLKELDSPIEELSMQGSAGKFFKMIREVATKCGANSRKLASKDIKDIYQSL